MLKIYQILTNVTKKYDCEIGLFFMTVYICKIKKKEAYNGR